MLKTIGFALTIASSLFAGWAAAWNGKAIGAFVKQAGGLFPLIAALLALGLVVLVIFWPKKWSDTLRKVATATALLLAILFGGEPIRAAITQAPWLVLGIGVALTLLVGILYELTIFGEIRLFGLIHPRRKSGTRS